MKNKFTPKAEEALHLAFASASELGHTYIGSEHILLGLCAEGSGIAARYLSEHGISAEAVREKLRRLSGEGEPTSLSAADMTPRTRLIIQASSTEARKRGHELIGTEHLLAALLSHEDCVAAKILESLDASVSDLAAELSQQLSSAPDAPAAFGKDLRDRFRPLGASALRQPRRRDR